MNNSQKYNRYEPFVLHDRTWPSNTITHAPIWSSVDLRDGNQALPVPMTIEKKLIMFKHLVRIGLKQIEVGFPFASDTDFNFVRTLIEDKHIPDDVTVLVLSSCSKECIDKSFESVKGARQASIQIYSLCSPAQRKYVINMSKNELLQYTADAAAYTRNCANKYSNTDFTLSYGPESFTITEIDFSLAVCNSVVRAWEPSADNKCMITLPSTVEVSMPNQFADQVEYIHRNLIMRDHVILGIHAHNDRGTGVAASELGLLAGAERLEGTLFGNGERTGNMDLITIALNMYTTGIDPKLDFSQIDESVKVYEQCTGLKVYDRHPYAGKYVFTAYSGGHQDAIRKGLLYRAANNEEKWLVPYIPVDPADLGRSMDNIIQINSQSGKGGIHYILEKHLDITLPKPIQAELGKHVKVLSDRNYQLLSAEEVLNIFLEKYGLGNDQMGAYRVDAKQMNDAVDVMISWQDQELKTSGPECRLVDLCFDKLKEVFPLDGAKIIQHTNSEDKAGRFYTFVQMQFNDHPPYHSFGWGLDKNTTQIMTLISTIEKALVLSSL
ncbi:2-isopropylmalate synthase [compost metagenome]